jgi:hypothetical protein
VNGRERPAHPRVGPAVVLGDSSGRFLKERARVDLEALIQNPQAASCGGLRLGGLVILFVARGGPRRGIGGGPVHHVGFYKLERLAAPSVPSSATPQLTSDFTPRTLLHAEGRSLARVSPSTQLAPGRWLRLRDRKWL